MSQTILGFTSKKAFKDLTFAIKEALPNSVKVADIRDAVAKFERFPSSNAYMDQLDRQEGRFICDESLVDPEIKKFASGSIKKGITPRYFATFESMGTKTWNIWFFWTEDGNNYSGGIFFGLSLDEAIHSTNFLNRSFLGYDSYDDLRHKIRPHHSAIQLGFPESGELEDLKIQNPYENSELCDALLDPSPGSGRSSLQSLLLHLYNFENKVSLPRLFNNLDKKNKEFAFQMMEWYDRYGENDEIFMELARQVNSIRLDKLAYVAGREIAERVIYGGSTNGDVPSLPRKMFQQWKDGFLAELAEDLSLPETRYGIVVYLGSDALKKRLIEGIENFSQEIMDSGEWPYS